MVGTSMIEQQKRLWSRKKEALNHERTTVLCIEESPNIMRKVVCFLPLARYQVIWAQTLNEALQYLSIYQVDLIMMDSRIQEDLPTGFVKKLQAHALQNPKFRNYLLVNNSRKKSTQTAKLGNINIQIISLDDLSQWIIAFTKKL